MAMPSDEGPICIAKPSRAEWVRAAIVYFFAALLLSLFLSQGVDAVFVDFLTDDHAANRWRMAAIFVPSLLLLVVVTYRANRSRFYRLFADRLEIGRGRQEVVRLADVRRMRVGAPAPGWVKNVERTNAALGKVSARNARAAQHVHRQFARTVVLDVGSRERQVINLATVEHGDKLLAELARLLGDKLESPPSYTDDELAAFGRFVPRRYVV